MKKLASAFLLYTLLAFSQGASHVAPPLSIHMSDGSQTPLSKYRGKVTMVAFLHTQCQHCQALCKTLMAVEKEYQPKGVQVLGVVFDDGAAKRLDQFKTQYCQSFPVGYSDEATVMSFLNQDLAQGYFVPILAFLDKKGALRSQHLGDDIFFQDANNNIRKTLNTLLAGH